MNITLSFADTFFIEKTYESYEPRSLKTAVIQVVGSEIIKNGHTLSSNPKKSNFIIKVGLTLLKKTYLITLTKVKGRKTIISKTAKSKNADELDIITQKLTQSILKKSSIPITNSKKVGEIKESEVDELQRRIKSKNSNSIGLGPSLFLGEEKEQALYHIFGGYNWEVNPRTAIKWQASISAGKDTYFFSETSLGINFFFSNLDISPYIGLDFGLGAAKIPNYDSLFGFKSGGNIGLHFFRTSTTQMTVFLKYDIIFKEKNYPKRPQQFLLALGILF